MTGTGKRRSGDGERGSCDGSPDRRQRPATRGEKAGRQRGSDGRGDPKEDGAEVRGRRGRDVRWAQQESALLGDVDRCARDVVHRKHGRTKAGGYTGGWCGRRGSGRQSGGGAGARASGGALRGVEGVEGEGGECRDGVVPGSWRPESWQRGLGRRFRRGDGYGS